MSDVRWLSERESAAWTAVRNLGQPLWTALSRDLQRDSGLSMADYQVLVVLSARDDSVLSYRELAESTGWEKSRLSHHITRMEKRGLVARRECSSDGRSADIVLTPQGRSVIESAAPGHVKSVRHFLIDALSDDEISTLIAIGERVCAAVSAAGHAAAAEHAAAAQS